MGTVCPSGILISFRTPAEGEGISASTLSVEISKSGSSRSTLSPGFFSHLVMVPSKMLSPIWGITTSTAMGLSPRVAELPNPGALLAGGRAEVNRTSLQGKAARRKVRCLACIPERLFLETGRRGLEAGQCFGGGEHFLRVGEEGFLEGRSVGDGGVEGGDANERAIEIVKGFFAEDGGDFACDATGFGVFVDDQALVGFLDGLEDGFFVKREQCAQVDDFGF